MQDWVSNEIIQVVIYLLPGFIVTWIFYSLTRFAKPSEFERVIQALIYTVFVQTLVAIIRLVAFVISISGHNFGSSTTDTQMGWSVVIAIVLGLSCTWLANTDKLHNKLRKLGFTKETSYPSQWYGQFYRHYNYVVLHFEDGRRIYGWAVEWPSEPEKGHFVLADADWLIEKDGQNKSIPLTKDKSILIPSKLVTIVEFVENPNNQKESSYVG